MVLFRESELELVICSPLAPLADNHYLFDSSDGTGASGEAQQEQATDHDRATRIVCTRDEPELSWHSESEVADTAR